MEQVAGVVALALVVLWGAYLLPQRLRQRNQIVEARVEDRFSGSLRVLAVAKGPGGLNASAGRECSAGTVKGNRLLTPPMGVVMAGSRAQAQEGAGNMEPTTDGTGAQVAQESTGQTGAVASPSSFPAAPRVNRPARPAPVRRHIPATEPVGPGPAVRAQRAAAAQRRLSLTVALLVASVGSWVVTSLTPLSVIFPIVATALLGTVLVLGRRAVVSAQRGDAARAAKFGQDPTGGGVTPPQSQRTARKRPKSTVVGHAVYGNQAQTQIIATVPGGARGEEQSTSTDTVESSAAPEAVSGEAGAEPEAKSEVSDEAPSGETAAEQGGELKGFTLPRSTYVTKASAPKREPAPLTPEDVTTPANASAKAQAARSAEETESVVDEGMEIAPEGLGVDLNQILARRRAAGA